MKKIATLLLIANFAFAYNQIDVDSFRQGFVEGIRALKFQKENDGLRMQEIKTKKPFAIILHIEKLTNAEILFLQMLANKEGYKTHLAKTYIVFGEYDRSADAIYHARNLYDKFKIKPNIKKLGIGYTITINPMLYTEVYEEFLNDVKNKGYAIKTQYITKSIPTKKITPVKKIEIKKEKPTEYIILKKQKAMVYKKNKSGLDVSSKDFEEISLTNGKLPKEDMQIISTHEGEKFYKIKGENKYINIQDVKEIK